MSAPLVVSIPHSLGREEAMRRQSGIPYSGSEIAPLQQEAERAAVAPLAVSHRPLGT